MAANAKQREGQIGAVCQPVSWAEGICRVCKLKGMVYDTPVDPTLT